MRICSPQLGLSEKSVLGGEVHDVNLLKELAQKGVLIDVLLPKGRDTFGHKNLFVKRLPFKSVFPPHLFNLYALSYIFGDYSKNKFDILRIHSPYFLGFAALVFKKKNPNVKVVTTIHLKETRPDFKVILSNTINVYDHIFAVSNYLKDWIIREYGVDPQKITVVYNGVDNSLKPESKNKQLQKRLNLENKVTLLNIGLLVNRKNPLVLLDIYKRLVINYPNLALLFCGSGPLKHEINKIIKDDRWKERVRIIEPVFGKDKKDVFNLADIFIFPSQNEGFGLVAAEAMACGKPVIASDNSSLPELVEENETGYLAQTNDLDTWINKITELIDNPKRRVEFGKKARVKQQTEFTWEKVADKTLKVYKELL